MTSMNRRSFLATSSALGLASVACSAGLGLPPLGPKNKRIRKALKFGMIGSGASIEEKFRIAKACGFDGVELDAPSTWNRGEIQAAKEAAGIEVPGVVLSSHWQKPFNHPDSAVRKEAKADLERAIRDCKAVGGSSVLVVPAVVNEAMPYEEAYQYAQREIRELVPLAEELSIDIAFENVWNNFLLSPIEAARFCDEFESERVGWYFDIGNIINYGYPAQWIETLGNRIKKLDVKDFSRTKRNDEGLWKGFGVKIGDGDANWPSVCKALDEIRYSGWATAEVAGGDEARLTDIANRMDRAFSSLVPRG